MLRIKDSLRILTLLTAIILGHVLQGQVAHADTQDGCETAFVTSAVISVIPLTDVAFSDAKG